MTDQKAGYQRVGSGGMTSMVRVPNDTISGDGFFVSFNTVDEHIYGDVTTALVWGQMQAFYILDGNHMAQYADLIDDGFEACMAYFEENIDLINRYSERPVADASTGMSI